MLDKFRAHPAGELVGFSKNRRHANQPASALQNLGQEQLYVRPSLGIGQQLQFVRDHQLDLREAFRPPHQDLAELFVNHERDGKISRLQLRVELTMISRRDNDLKAVGGVFLLEIEVFFLRQGFQWDKIDHFFAAQGCLNCREFAHKGLAGTRGRLDEQIAIAKQVMALDGQFLDGQEVFAFPCLPQTNHLRRNVIPEQFRHFHPKILHGHFCTAVRILKI